MNASKKSDLSCTFCGPGTWATWEVVTDDGVIFACDRHHVEMSEAEMIRLERMRGKETWDKVPTPREILYEEEYLADVQEVKEEKDFE
jgi:hypothetical protein